MADVNWFYKDLSKMNKSGAIEPPTEEVCSACKTHRSDFLDTSFVGCPNCYVVFKQDIGRAIENYHGASEHVGKVPEKVVSKEITRQEIERLEKLKRQAVNAEDYILADSLQQKIKSLRGER